MEIPAGNMDLDDDDVTTPRLEIGSYTIGETIGSGTFGKVKLAKHMITGLKVAVKILNRSKIRYMKMDRKIKREIQILQLFNHPHIIRMYEVIETQSDVFMFMEYVSGGELFDLIVNRGRLTEPEARRFFQQIISGVEYCHWHKIVHRDLKPENLLLDAAGNVKIADFGLSNIMADGDFLSTSCGSPNYAAPEVISGHMYSGQEIDIWSCGVILYALVCGKLPFDEDYIPTLFQKIRNGIYQIPSSVGSGCADIISKLLEVNPIKRITIPEIKAHSWFRVDWSSYLRQAIPNKASSSRILHINKAIVKMVVQKMGIDAETVVNKLKSDYNNEVTVTYSLLLDNNPQLREDIPEETPKESDEALQAMRSLGTSPAMDMREEGNIFPHATSPHVHATSVGALAMQVSKSPGSFRSGSMFDSEDDTADNGFGRSLGRQPMNIGGNGSAKSRKLGKMWYLGTLTEKPADVVMSECYRVLRLCDYEWKMVTKWHIRVRPVARRSRDRAMSTTKKRRSFFGSREMGDDGREIILPSNDNVKFEIHLYRVNAQQCLLDFKKLSGEGTTMGYLVTCHTILSCLNL